MSSTPLFVKVRQENGRITMIRRELFTQEQLARIDGSPDRTFTPSPSNPLPLSKVSVATQTPSFFFNTDIGLKQQENLELVKKLEKISIDDFSGTIPTSKARLNPCGQLAMSNMLKNIKLMREKLGPGAKRTILSNATTFASCLTGISSKTLKRLPQPEEIDWKVEKTHKESVKNTNSNALKHVPSYIQTAIDKQMRIWWAEEENITLKSIREWLVEEYDYHTSRTNLARILSALDYCWRIKTYNPLANNNEHIVRWRRNYSETIAKYRAENCFITYYDETWIFDGMNPIRGWMHKNTNPYNIVNYGDIANVAPGPVAGNTKGKRGVVLGVHCEYGILRGSEQVIISGAKESQQFMDYHREMNSDSFEEYMKKIIPNLAKTAKDLRRTAVIVIDNAAYHNRVLEKLPTSASTKSELVQYLNGVKVVADMSMKRNELWQKAKEYFEKNGGRKRLNKYWFDSFAAKYGVKVLRLPPYHCKLNPIELVWHQLKSHLCNIGKSKDPLEIVRKRCLEWMRGYSKEQSAATIAHVIEIEEEMEYEIYKDDQLKEIMRQEVLKQLEVSDDSDSSITSDNDEFNDSSDDYSDEF